MNESNGVLRDARKLGIPKMLILGLQHMFAMFGATILVPILVNSYFVDACGEGPSRGLTVSVTLFCAGFGTLLFHLCAKFKVPAFLGSSFAFLSGFAAVANLNTGKYASMSVNDKAAYACGGIVVAGLLYLIFALIIRMVGVKRVMRYLLGKAYLEGKPLTKDIPRALKLLAQSAEAGNEFAVCHRSGYHLHWPQPCWFRH